jgi:hypothetical protein
MWHYFFTGVFPDIQKEKKEMCFYWKKSADGMLKHLLTLLKYAASALFDGKMKMNRTLNWFRWKNIFFSRFRFSFDSIFRKCKLKTVTVSMIALAFFREFHPASIFQRWQIALLKRKSDGNRAVAIRTETISINLCTWRHRTLRTQSSWNWDRMDCLLVSSH